MKKIICFAAAGLLFGSLRTSAHRIEYYTSNGCINPSQSLVIDAVVTYAPSNTYYRWQYKGNNGTWTCFNNGTNSINGSNFTVSNASGTGADNAPALTISSPSSVLDNVQVRCLMRENASPCNAPSGTTWGGDDLNQNETKVLRLRYNANTGACAISCVDNILSNSDGYYGGFEAVTYSNGNFTNKNFLSGAGSSDYNNGGSGSGSFKVMNNPYAAYSFSSAKFAPHSGNYQMIVKGNTTASAEVWYKTISVQPGQVYSFSVWVSRVDGTQPKIQLKAGNTELIATQITASIGTWTQVTGTYSVPPGISSVMFAIKDKDAGSGANNYVLDDICLVKTDDPISIGDKVWFDVDRDGRQDSGEPGISGVTVKLFYDNNGNNVADSSNATFTTTTNSSGNYTFNGVIPGKYFVQFTLASGYDAFTTQDAAGVPVGENSTANVSTGKTGTHNFTDDYLFKDAGMVKNFGISGKVYNDVEGLTDNTVDGTLISSLGSTALHANLFKGTVFVATTPVSGGNYTFSNLPGNTNYTVAISTVAATASSSPASVLSAGWVNTGEFIGTGAGNDGTVNGQLSVNLTTTGVSNANFGVEELPTPISNTAPNQPNPGGTNSVTVPPATFGGTDPSGGTITSLRITGFPTGATTITINGTTYTSSNFPSGGVTVPTNTSGQPTQTISVDPAGTGSTTVTIPFKVTDNASKESSTTGTATIPFVGYTISGNVFNDINGLTDNTVNGTGIGTASSAQLKAYLTTTAGAIVDSVNVAANGTYTLENVAGNTNYVVIVTTASVAIGGSNPAITLPAGWVNTGEFIGTASGNDGTANGSLAVNVASGNVSNANFGIEQLPTPATNTAASQVNPGGTNSVTVPAATFGGTDPSGGTITSLRITSFPTGATSITINGTNYTSSSFPGAGVNVPTNTSGQPTQTIAVDPAAEGATSVVISYKVTDNAGKESTATGTATMPFTGLTISGKVFNDVNGLTDNTVNGTGIGTASAAQLKAYLTKTTGGVIIDSAHVASNGTFSFDNASGNTSYTVIVTTTNAAIGNINPAVTFPAGWVNTGEFLGTGAGNDGNANGALTVVVATSNVSNANFGIEERPTAGTSTATPQVNPGDTISVTVPAATFVSSDVAPGTVASIKITGLPTNANSLTVGSIKYTSANFPAGGVVIPTNTSGQPTQVIKLDPIDGTVTSSIPFQPNDNANVPSANIGAANVPVYELPDLTPIITVAPTTMYGTSNFVTRVDVYNLAQDAPSAGLITVYVTKSTLINYTFNPTMTNAAGSPVQNSVWTMDATSNSSYYLFTTNLSIEPQGVLSFGLNGTLTPGATQGQLNNTVIIYPGSGNETNFINNTDAETINYFPTNE